MQLALAQQLAESDRRLAEGDRRLLEQQFASEMQIRELTIRAELLAAAAALVPQPQGLNVVAVGDKYTFQLAMTTLTNYVQNPTLAGPISLDAVVDVNQIAAVVAMLFKLLGSVGGAARYKQFLQHALQLPDPGSEISASGYSDSAECARLESVFGVEERPSSPEGSQASTVTSCSSRHRHTESTADRVAAALYGESALADQLLSQFRTVDEVLLTYLRHLIIALPGTAVHDCTLHTTFIRCLAGLLRCAGHGADKDEKRWITAAYGPCNRYTAQGGVGALSIAQLSDAAIRDWERRRHYLGRLNPDAVAAVLTVAGMPSATGGLRGEAANALKKVLIKLAGSGNMDVATLTEAMDEVVDEFRHLPLTGAFTGPDPAALHKALGMSPMPPPPVSLAAVSDKSGTPKPGNRTQQPVPPAAEDEPNTPPPGKNMCPRGPGCTRVVLAWETGQPGRTKIVEPCTDWHTKREFQVVVAAARDRLVAASIPATTVSVPPVMPIVMPVPAAPTAAPDHPARASQVAILQAYIAAHRPGPPSTLAVRPENVEPFPAANVREHRSPGAAVNGCMLSCLALRPLVECAPAQLPEPETGLHALAPAPKTFPAMPPLPLPTPVAAGRQPASVLSQLVDMIDREEWCTPTSQPSPAFATVSSRGTSPAPTAPPTSTIPPLTSE